MATLVQMRSAVDAWLDGKFPTIVARQENYRANRGSYWQGLRTHSSPPAYTNAKDGSSLGNRLGIHPTDQFEDWLAVFPEWASEALPVSVWVDVYDGPTGKGWAIGVEATYDGILWRRVKNVGPETHREVAWSQVIPRTR